METIIQDQFNLMNLPIEVIEEILSYLPVEARKNLRLTCKCLFELCNKKRFCAKEVITWSYKIDAQLITFCKSTRPYYNLVMKNVFAKNNSILSFFKVHSSRVYSLCIKDCKFPPGLLEAIIAHCEALIHLSIAFRHDFCTFELESIVRPHVTSLQLIVPDYTPQSSYFYSRIFSTFPNIKNLDLQCEFYTSSNVEYNSNHIEQAAWDMVDDIMKLSCLESLKLNCLATKLLRRGSQFFNAVPLFLYRKIFLSYYCGSVLLHYFFPLCSLKNLSLSWHDEIWSESIIVEELSTYFKRLSSLEFLELYNDPSLESILPLLGRTELKKFAFSSNELVITPEVFKVLVSSQLKIINFDAHKILQRRPGNRPIIRCSSLPADVNKTVTDLTLEHANNVSKSILPLFSVCFRGLVHLKLNKVSNVVLQNIFEYQENLRSLYLSDCSSCTVAGFLGRGTFKHSIRKLEKLEHLTVKKIRSKIINSKNFQTTFNSLRIKYLYIERCWFELYDSNYKEIPVELFESLISLEAMKLVNFKIPSHEKLLQLYKNLKQLKFLHINVGSYGYDPCTIIDLRHFPLKDSDYDENWVFGCECNHYDEVLDRLILTNYKSKNKIRWRPKISSFIIDWICV